MNYEPFTSIKNHLIILNLSALIRVIYAIGICGWRYSTIVESSLQITPFYAKQTQSPKKSNDVSFFYTMDYENICDWTIGENKPNSNPIKPNCQKGKIDTRCVFTKHYEEKCG